jgi:hypothetical protein
LEHDVKRTRELNRSIPLHDYSPALQSAVSWLGDRYLLAEPMTRRVEERKPFYKEPPRWHPALWGAGSVRN